MMVLTLISFLISPLLSLGMLCYLSELCRERVLGLVGIRPLLAEDADWWTVYGLDEDGADGWDMDLLVEQEIALRHRIARRSWYPRTDTYRRQQAFQDATEGIQDLERQRRATQHRSQGAAGSTGSGSTRTPPRAGAEPWHQVLGVAHNAEWATVRLAYKRLVSRHGAYLKGGTILGAAEWQASHNAMARITRAMADARAETGKV